MGSVRCLWTVAVLVASLLVYAGAQLPELAEAPSCYDGAQASASQGPMVGGYGEISDPSNNEDVMTVTELAMARLNRVVGQNYVLTDDGMVALAQVI